MSSDSGDEQPDYPPPTCEVLDEGTERTYRTLARREQRTFDALAQADAALSRATLEWRTHHAESTVQASLRTLRDVGLVERVDRWPVPLYELVE